MYVLMIIAGGFYFRLDIDVVTLIIYTVISVVIGLLLEFFVFGGDYTRTERLEYEDDEYYYYVKAVPKACVTTSERSIKKINGSSAKDERPAQQNAEPLFRVSLVCGDWRCGIAIDHRHYKGICLGVGRCDKLVSDFEQGSFHSSGILLDRRQAIWAKPCLGPIRH